MERIDLIVLGAGGNSLGIIEAARRAAAAGAKNYHLVGILDDLPHNQGAMVLDVPVLGPIDTAGQYASCRFINGISSIDSFRKMPDIIRRTGLPRERFETVIDPAAIVSPTAAIGNGTAVLVGSYIGVDTAVGDHTIILQNTTVNHHSSIGDFCTLSAGVTILGYVRVESNAFISGGASLAPRVQVGYGAIAGLGAVVLKDVPAGRVVAGNPAVHLAASKYNL